MRHYLIIAMLLVFITGCKKKEDIKTEEQNIAASAVPSPPNNNTITPTPTTAPTPSTITTPTLDYRDSITGKYLVTYTVTYKGGDQYITDTAKVRKAIAGEVPHWHNGAPVDSCVTVEFVYYPANGTPVKSAHSTRLRPDLIGYREYNTTLDLRNQAFYFVVPCCYCGSATCSTAGKGAKLP